MQIVLDLDKEFNDLYYSFLKRMGKPMLKLEGIDKEQLDITTMSYNYFTKNLTEVSIDNNANIDNNKSPSNYMTEIVKGLLKLEGYYLIWKYAKKRFGLEKANELIWSIWSGDLYFHDSSGVRNQMYYCCAFSTTHLMHEGRRYGQLHSLPPKRADSFISQVIESTMDLSQEFAGAIAPADLIVNYCYYAKKENLPDYRILNDLQRFVHVVNNKFRLGTDSPFVNLSLFDRPNLEIVFKDYVYPDGSKPDYSYIMYVQKLFGEWFSKGDPATGLPYRFPICSVNLFVNEKGEIVDQDFLEWLSKNNIEKACFNIYVNKGYRVATCCRLSNSMSEIRKIRSDTFGNGGISIGSSRVVTLNLPRIARLSNGSKERFFEILERFVVNAKDLLMIHRKEILKRRVESGFLKFFKPLNWLADHMFFATFGVVGIYEMTELMGLNILTPEGQDFVASVLSYIDKRAEEFSLQEGIAMNVEEIPAETTAVTLAQKDKLYFGSNNYEMYSNQYIPLIADADIFTRIKLSGKFMELTSGGGILHLNIQDKIQNSYQMRRLIEICVQNGVTHFAVNYGYLFCNDCGISVVVGNTSRKCPNCNSNNIDYLTRVVGYYSKVSAWNPVRRDYEMPRRNFVRMGDVGDI